MAPFKRNISSLVGGIAVAAGVWVLWLLLADSLTAEAVVPGLVVAAAIGGWVRLADL